jgi:hypothetical protein
VHARLDDDAAAVLLCAVRMRWMDLAARETCACANYLYTHVYAANHSTQQIPTQINLSGIGGGGGRGSWRQINFSLFHPQSAAADAARTRSHAHKKISTL